MTHPTEARLREALEQIAAHAETVMAYLQEYGPGVVPHLLDTDDNPGQRLRESIDEALAALSQPEGGEEKPVAWRWEYEDDDRWVATAGLFRPDAHNCIRNVQPLYTHPLPAHEQRVDREALEKIRIAAINGANDLDDPFTPEWDCSADNLTIIKRNVERFSEIYDVATSTLSDAPCVEEGGSAVAGIAVSPKSDTQAQSPAGGEG